MRIQTLHCRSKRLLFVDDAEGNVRFSMEVSNSGQLSIGKVFNIGGMAAHNTSPSASTLKFPEWQQHYLAVLTETDRKKLTDRVTDAENAIFHRLQSLVGSADHHAERQAIEDALNALRVLKRETLDFPDWE